MMIEEQAATRCAIYTRKSSGNRLEAEINSLSTQREVCSAYIKSQQYKSWRELPESYDDGKMSGADLDRPALARLMDDIEQGKIDNVVVYKIDRLTRSLVDFVRLIDLFEQRNINLVAVSQAFDTSDSMGRMVLNILLTFSQFEREMIGERVRDSLRARKRHGKIHGGKPPFGYQIVDDALVVDEHEANIVRFVYNEFIRTERYLAVQRAVESKKLCSSRKPLRKGGWRGGGPISSSIIYGVLRNPVYVGEIRGNDKNYPGRHQPLISRELWDRAQELVIARKRPAPNPKGTKHFLARLLRDELGRSMYLDIQRKPDGRIYTFYSSTDARWSRTQYLKAYRCNASKLDKLVLAGLVEFFLDRRRLRQALKVLGVTTDELDSLATNGHGAAKRLEQTAADRLEAIAEALIVELEVGRAHLSISIRLHELKRFLKWEEGSEFRPRKGDWPLSSATYDVLLEVQAISPEKWPTLNVEPCRPDVESSPDQQLIKLIGEARTAQRLMDAHRDLSIPELAKNRGVRPSQFSRLIRVNYLAPDIAASILDGTQPAGFTRKELLASNIPTDWSLQRRLFGFPQPQREVTDRGGGMWPSRFRAQTTN